MIRKRGERLTTAGWATSGSGSRRTLRMLVACLLVVGASSVAWATASSGFIFKGNVNGKATCTEAIIADVADNKGWTYVFSAGACSTAQTVPSGHIGVRIRGWRNGGICANWGLYNYNSGTAHAIGVGGKLCSNPAGSQDFQTQANSHRWSTDCGCYFVHSLVTSPAQNY